MTAEEKNYLYNSIGSKIKQYRTSNSLSQIELANKLNKSRVSIVNIENGKQQTTLSMLVEIALLFDVSLDAFIPKNLKDLHSESNTLQSKLNKEALIKSKSHKDVIDTMNILKFLNSVKKDNS